jgi:hypothetical protein
VTLEPGRRTGTTKNDVQMHNNNKKSMRKGKGRAYSHAQDLGPQVCFGVPHNAFYPLTLSGFLMRLENSCHGRTALLRLSRAFTWPPLNEASCAIWGSHCACGSPTAFAWSTTLLEGTASIRFFQVSACSASGLHLGGPTEVGWSGQVPNQSAFKLRRKTNEDHQPNKDKGRT